MRAALLLGLAACGAKMDGAPDADARCATQAALLAVHPHAAAQPTTVGQDLVDTRTAWLHSAVELGEFTHPIVFAGRIVSVTLGELWAFDGAHMTNLGVTLYDTTPALDQPTLQPLALFTDTEAHVLAVNAQREVLATTDLATWTCVGHAPADVRSLGSLDGTIYFGGSAGQVYGYAAPSW